MKILCRLLLLAAALVIGGYLGDIFLSSSDFGSAGISIFAIACTFFGHALYRIDQRLCAYFKN